LITETNAPHSKETPVMLRRFCTALLLVSFSTVSISAQKTPDQQPRKVKQEPKKAFVNWINDVDLILTKSERDAWKKLETDDEREKFIEDVWHSRDLIQTRRRTNLSRNFSSASPTQTSTSHPVSRAASQIAAGSTSNSASLTRSSRILPVVRTIAPLMKAADRQLHIRSRSGFIVTSRMSEAALSSSLLTRPDRASTA